MEFPGGIAFDSSGDLYIADTFNDRVQEVPSSSGTQWGQSMTVNDIYTVAGDAGGGFGDTGDGGPATSALLGFPAGLAIDSSGNLYIADSDNSRIQEVASSSGSQWGQSMTADDMYTVAGDSGGSSGTSGDGGAATSALLEYPDGVAVDASGDLYVSDSSAPDPRGRGGERLAVGPVDDRRRHLHRRW